MATQKDLWVQEEIDGDLHLRALSGCGKQQVLDAAWELSKKCGRLVHVYFGGKWWRVLYNPGDVRPTSYGEGQ